MKRHAAVADSVRSIRRDGRADFLLPVQGDGTKAKQLGFLRSGNGCGVAEEKSSTYYRQRAQEARAQASLLKDANARALLLQVARDYEALAEGVDRRQQPKRSS
jgi:hypothetical protein